MLAACAHLGEPHVVVFGSQSILGSFDEDTLPDEAVQSREVDLAPGSAFTTGGELEDKLEILNVFVGEQSPFHSRFGFYVEGIHKDVVVLPNGWEHRLVRFTVPGDRAGGGYGRTGLYLDPVDLCASKVLAGREKDHAFVAALVRAGLVDAADIVSRINGEGVEWPPTYTDDRDVALARALGWLASLGR